MKQLRDNKGFTLIELMIVVVIIGILAAIAIPKFTSVSDGAKQAEAAPILKQICSLAEAERLKTNAWPDVEIADLPGWDDSMNSPDNGGAEYFAFSYDNGVAIATTETPNLVNQEMNCETREITESAA